MTTEPQDQKEEFEMEQDIGEVTVDKLKDVLRRVIDPELHMNIVDLGLVYEVKFEGGIVDIQMTLTSPMCPFGPYIMHQVMELSKSVKGVDDCKIDVVWEPMWSPEKMTEEARLELGFDL